MNRLSWVDNAKGIAIYLVVLGHFSGLTWGVKNFIYAFHLPLFLLVSGFLICNKLSHLKIRELFDNQLYSLIKLYFMFSILSILIFISITIIKGQPFDIIALFFGTLYGVHGVDKLLGHGNGALWYFPFFISSVVFFYFILKFPRYLSWIVTCLFALGSIFYDGSRLPWAIDVAGVGVFFLLLGGELKSYYEKVQPLLISKMHLYSIPLLVFLLFYLTNINGTANINRAAFGENIFLYFINAIVGCWLVLVISHNIKPLKILRLFSTHTLIIFSIHLYIVKSLRVVTSIDSTFVRMLLIFVISFLITYFCMQLSRLLMPVLNKYLLSKNNT